jgi:8-oxo-dGTP diphosphatase
MERIRVVCALIERDGKVLAARRPSGMSNAGLWELPGGKIREGETPQQALARELAEEFRVDSTVGERFGLSVHEDLGRAIELTAFRCDVSQRQFECVEHDEIRWVGPQGAMSLQWTAADVPLVRKWCRGDR